MKSRAIGERSTQEALAFFVWGRPNGSVMFRGVAARGHNTNLGHSLFSLLQSFGSLFLGIITSWYGRGSERLRQRDSRLATGESDLPAASQGSVDLDQAQPDFSLRQRQGVLELDTGRLQLVHAR